MVAIHRLGLAIASTAAILTVVLSIAIVNFVTSQAGAAGPTAAPQATSDPATAADAISPTAGPPTIYLRFPPATPAPKPGAGSYRAAPTRRPAATPTPTPTRARSEPTPDRTPRPRRSPGPTPSGGDD